ncbi:MAG: serine protease PepD [Amycolatopsis sp.]|jgi:putative serine protease PepD|uniref:S1C family serine protease n=1 Tax=Amycolatopsis sp. TaxID=37632 RepID=UPI002626FC3D|nr:trypsin-like peptidase domain-containing protein [Amycolatopsis sp.]MCU1685105.1 serine protease PepD [Amycolatopsis sp.]
MTENESRPGPASTGGHQPQQPPHQQPHAAYAPYYGYQQQQPPPPPVNPLFQQQPPAPKPKKNRLGLLVGTTALAAALIGGVSGAVIVGVDSPTSASSTNTASAVTGQQALNSSPTDVSTVAAKVLPSVVQINVTTQQGEAIGSGVILNSTGRILTNAHVVDGAVGDVTVTLSDGTKYQASVVGADTKGDIAVIQAKNAKNLSPATLGDSSKLAVGDQVVAIGSPGGLQNTVTSGIVSALNRPLSDVGGGQQQQSPFNSTSNSQAASPSYQAIQTDASINQGNSGGALVNSAGQVIGINSAIYSPTQSANGAAGSVGIGFAIPINDAKTIVSKIVAG